MVRKTKEEALRTREAILDAAERVFQERGVARTTMDDIAREAGCTRGALYWHFQNKIDLFNAMLERVELPMFDQFERLLRENGSDPMGSLQRSCVFALRDIEENPRTRNTLDILINRCETVDEMAAAKQRQFERHQYFLKHSTEALRRAQGAGQIRAGLDPALCAFMLHTMSIGLIREWLLEPASFSLAREGERAIVSLFEGFGYSGAPTQRKSAAPGVRGAPARAAKLHE